MQTIILRALNWAGFLFFSKIPSIQKCTEGAQDIAALFLFCKHSSTLKLEEEKADALQTVRLFFKLKTRQTIKRDQITAV